VLTNLLQDLGYYSSEFLLSPKQYGIPNARLRYYLAARKAESTSNPPSTVLTAIPGDMDVAMSGKLREIADYLDPLPDISTMVPERILARWGKVFDIVLPSSSNSCCFTRGNRFLYYE
jgi:tRNA (cytosine38-C5)-methyltransferase